MRNRKWKIWGGLVLCCLLLIGNLSAQEHYVDGVSGNALQTGASIDIEDQYYRCTRSNNCPHPFDLASTRLYAKLSFDDALRKYYGSEWQVKVDYDVQLYTYQTTTVPPPASIPGSLTINYHPSDNYQDIDLFVRQPGSGNPPYTRAVLKVTNVTVTDRAGGPIPNPFGSSPQAIADDILLELHLEVDRVYQLDVNQVPAIVNTGIYQAATQELRVHWDYLPGAEEYDLEWLFIDMTNKNPGDLFQLDFRNATRVTTQQHFYSFSLAYPRGYLVYRVRAVGRAKSDPASNVYDKRVEGRWSFEDRGTYKQNGSDLVPDPALSNPFGLYNGHCSDFYFWDGLETNKNWQYTATYAEDGKRKEVINFYDDILKSQQSVTVLNTDETAIVAEPVYDYAGRNSLQVLPAPQRSQGIRFYSPLHYNGSGQVYDYEDFDLDNLLDKPAPLSPQLNLGAGYYYSAQNTSPLGINGEYTPDAQGYPFSRTIYKNDGSGRVKALSGIGKEYFDGPGKSMQHTTRFFYSSPFQEELFLLFGNEVGHARYYEKTVVVDANGQASSSIKDLSGRVVATALAGDAPENLYEIDTKPDNYREFTIDLSPLNEREPEALTINKVFTVVGNTSYTFEYEIDPAVFDSCGLRTTCVYDLLIYLLDEYGNRQEMRLNGNQVDEIRRDQLTGSRADRLPIKFTAQLATGSYQLVKELTLNEAALDQAVADWREQQNCYEPRQVQPITSCTPDCETLCAESYLTPVNDQGKQYYLAIDDGSRVAEVVNGTVTNVINPSKWGIVQDSIQACQDRCEAVDYAQPLFSECDLKYELLKQDMSPGGQYFDNLPDQYQADGVTLNPRYDRNGWLDRLNTAQINEIRTCLNIDREGEELWDYIRNHWQPEWADLLIKFHPEWCAFQTLCCGESRCTKDTTGQLKIVLSFADNCQVLDAVTQSKIRTHLATIDFNTLSQQAVAQISDPSLHAEFSPAKLKERAERFYEEYYQYQLVKKECEGLYLSSPDDDLYTADGFLIRYPENPLIEAFDPDDPTAIDQQVQDDICEEQARQAADSFVAKVKDQCGVLTPLQEKQLWQHIYEEYKRDCEDPAIQIDLNESIRNFISCTSQLPEACYVEALPMQSDTSCACGRINNFVYSVIAGDDPRKTFYDVISNPQRYGNDPLVQDALDVILEPGEASLKGDFRKWFSNCNDPDYYSWMGSRPAPPAQLANYFICDDTPLEPPCDTCCVSNINAFALAIADLEFERLLDLKAAEYRAALIDTCLRQASATERFTMNYEYREYHYTLYYYDQAGNLIKTVPPEGLFQKDPVDGTVYHNSLLKDNEIAAARDHLNAPDTYPFVHTRHVMVTNYQYNSLQNTLVQKTPDGDVTSFFYDALGRLVVSQNAEQQGRRTYSYLQYDVLGRTTEAGELLSNVAMTKPIAEDVTDYNNPAGANALLNWYAIKKRTERTLSIYDRVDNTIVPAAHPAAGQQHKLRNRISAVIYDENGDSYDNSPGLTNRELPAGYDAITHYDYDMLGNVETLWQENRKIPIGHQVKRMDYQYDLVSGNVNAVHYQRGAADQFSHRYAYDADNRLTKVWTSPNDIIWDQDAQYFYYAHGPLAREEIGDLHVFANDYIYDIRGWITGMNASTVEAKRDAGRDGVAGGLNENFGRDPFAFSLHYFPNHYKPIGAGVSDVLVAQFGAIGQTGNVTTADTKPLYNGNISMMVTSLKDVAQQPLEAMVNTYKYDQLNRIKSYRPFWDPGTNDPLASNTFNNATNTGDWNSSYVFDGNGNIHQLQRNGQGVNQQMDALTYEYDYASGKKEDNKLYAVKDAYTTAGLDLDLESQNSNNYQYDAIGRLTRDKAEEILRIDWNVSNKVTGMTRPAGSQRADLAFHYGPMGNRILKSVTEKDSSGTPISPVKHTWYVLDAQGNPLAIYGLEGSTLTLQDLILYGNKRLGMYSIDLPIIP